MIEQTKRRVAVLVVEDEPVQRMMAVDMVTDEGFEAVEATDATEAILILERRTDIRIVFSDIAMPRGVDGTRLAAMISKRWPPIRLILTSDKLARDAGEVPSRGLFFSKPYRRQDVVAAMRRMAA